MVGALLRHQQYGEGRVVANNGGHLRVLFLGNNAAQKFGSDSFNRRFLKHFLLERPTVPAQVGPYVIEQLARDGQGKLRTDHVQYENDLSAICTKADLEPFTASRKPRPSARLTERDLNRLLSFRCREALCGAQLQNLRLGGHIIALLSARIELHPHQAFVAGTVLDDRRRRYVLADEVRLGKTIEAGVITHELLSGIHTYEGGV